MSQSLETPPSPATPARAHSKKGSPGSAVARSNNFVVFRRPPPSPPAPALLRCPRHTNPPASSRQTPSSSDRPPRSRISAESESYSSLQTLPPSGSAAQAVASSPKYFPPPAPP